MSTAPRRRWEQVAPGVWVVRHRDLDLTTGVVVGSVLTELRERDPAAAALPRDVLYTHAHYDHTFGTAALWRAPASGRVDSGTAALLPAHVWAHEGCLADLRATGELQRESVVARYRSTGRQAAAERVAAVRPVLPTAVFTRSATVDLGGREVQLLHLGAGHTDHDAVAFVPDADVLFAGDLLENGAPPAFEDAHPHVWPVTLGRLLELLGPTAPGTTIVPGHGDPVDAAFVAGQRDDLAAVAAACAAGTVDGGPYPGPIMATALAAYRATGG